MHFRAPQGASMPHFLTILDDLPQRPDLICKHLDISPATLRRYVQAEHAPRSVMLALFWETRWWRSAADCEAANAARMHAQHAAMLRQQTTRMRGIIDALESERMGQGIAANVPMFRTG